MNKITILYFLLSYILKADYCVLNIYLSGEKSPPHQIVLQTELKNEGELKITKGDTTVTYKMTLDDDNKCLMEQVISSGIHPNKSVDVWMKHHIFLHDKSYIFVTGVSNIKNGKREFKVKRMPIKLEFINNFGEIKNKK